jgi:hypothetical protein
VSKGPINGGLSEIGRVSAQVRFVFVFFFCLIGETQKQIGAAEEAEVYTRVRFGAPPFQRVFRVYDDSKIC